jgi:hypothetical protein
MKGHTGTYRGTPISVMGTGMTPPADGIVIINSGVVVIERQAGDRVRCSITPWDRVDLVCRQQLGESQRPGRDHTVGGDPGPDVVGGIEFTVNLVCKHDGCSGPSSVDSPALTAIHIPNR